MPKFSQAFQISKTQPELDFIDISLTTDNRLFVDPFALSQKPDRWSQDAHRTLLTFFQRIVDDIRSGNEAEAHRLLLNLREPNETRLGYSAHRPQGAGIGSVQAEELFQPLCDSAAVRTGFINSLEESELMIEGISFDKISDLTTNVLRAHLADYTLAQCELYGIPRQASALPPCFNTPSMRWEARYFDLPVYRHSPILLVPKSIVRRSPAYNHQQYYQHFVLNFLQEEELNNPTSRLVRTLKNHTRVVYKKDVAVRYPRAKDFLYNFSREHPEVLREYREWLVQEEQRRTSGDVDEEAEWLIAGALAQALRAIPAGDARAEEYHLLMVGMVEFLFFPNLQHPMKEHEIHQGRKRIDILMENSATAGIFFSIATLRRLPCAYVPFECKNYTTEVANPELDQLAGRFSLNRGKMGFLCCRNFQDRERFIERCRDTIRDDRGLIIPLDDTRVLRLLAVIEDRHPDQIDDLLSEFVADVWAA
jgi:hypothetical protein